MLTLSISPRAAAALALHLVALAGLTHCAGDGGRPPAEGGTAGHVTEVAASASPTPRAPEAGAGAPAATTAAPIAHGPKGPGGLPPDLNVLMITIDSLRADMPWSGYPRDIAPVLTAFEKKAVSYTRAYAISSYTAMSLGGLLGARYPAELDRSGFFFGNYPDEVTMFPELLQKAGVKTLTAHAHFYFDTKAGFRQGFDVYEIIPGLSADNSTDRNVTSPQHLEVAQKILGDEANTGSRFFAWFHLLDPHDIYMKHAGAPSFGPRARDLYDGEVHYTDQHVGKLLAFVAAQPWGARTAVIISADHGEAFGEHGMTRHGFEIWDVLVRVPMMIHVPGASPRRIETPRSAIDLAPTIHELLAVAPDPAFQGKSLVPEILGGEAETRDVVVDLPRTSDNDRRRALVYGQYKLIAYGDDFRFDLFDVVADPGETRDIKRANKEAFEMMKARYAARVATIKDICPKPKRPLRLRGKDKDRPC